MACLAGLSLVLVLVSVIAIVSFGELKKSFDRVVSNEVAAILLADELKQRSEALAGLAPSLYAQGFNQDALLRYSMTTYSEQERLQQLLSQLSLLSDANGDAINKAKTAFFGNLDQIATTLFDSSAARQSLDAQVGQLATLQQQQLLTAGNGAGTAPRLFPAKCCSSSSRRTLPSSRRRCSGLSGRSTPWRRTRRASRELKELLSAEQGSLSTKRRLLCGHERRQKAARAERGTVR